jgi:hypothetical protein
MISYTTRNRPMVLDYSLKKLREIYDGFCIVIDDCSDPKWASLNKDLAMYYDCSYLYNETRWGIPRTKERGFRSLLTFDKQFWFDDDCYPKEGFFERMEGAMKHEPHLLHLREWAHIKKTETLDHNLAVYSGATACFMAFDKRIYDQIHGFQAGFGIYGEWHGKLSLKLSGRYVAVENSSVWIHSFDVDGVPQDFDGHFQSSLPMEERKNFIKH